MFMLGAGSCLAQQAPTILKGSQNIHNIAKTYILKSAELMPEENYSFQPTPDVRRFGDILGHVADAQYLFCSAVLGEKNPEPGVEKSWKSKAGVIESLKSAFAYCEKAYAESPDGSRAVKLFGMDLTVVNALDFNIAHNFEHYGNMATYMRLKGLVPASSLPKK